MPLTAQKLARMQNRAERYLINTCVIENETITQDATGAPVSGYATRGTVDCYLEAKDVSNVNPSNGRLEAFTEYRLYVPIDQTVEPSDRVTFDSRTYYAEGVVEADSARGCKAVMLTLRDAQ